MSQITKKAIAASLKNLMLTRSLDNITVTEVSDETGINRQTFYYHFKDIYDLVEWIYKEEALNSISSFKTYETWQEGYLKIFNYVYLNKEFTLKCYNSRGKDLLESFLFNATFNLLRDVVDEVLNERSVLDSVVDFISRFYSYGFIGIVIEWIKKDCVDDPKVLIEELNTLIEGDIEKAILKYL